MENFPEWRTKIPVASQKVLEELHAEDLSRPVEHRPVLPGELQPAILFTGQNTGDVEDQRSKDCDLRVGVRAQGDKALNIVARDVRLMEEAVKFIEAFNAIALFTRQPLALLANVIAMSVPGELFIRADASANSAKVSHYQLTVYIQSREPFIPAFSPSEGEKEKLSRALFRLTIS
jgi:hypothetical protein